MITPDDNDYETINLITKAYKWWLQSYYHGKLPIVGKGFWFWLRYGHVFTSSYLQFRKQFLGTSPKFLVGVGRVNMDGPKTFAYIDVCGWMHLKPSSGMKSYIDALIGRTQSKDQVFSHVLNLVDFKTDFDEHRDFAHMTVSRTVDYTSETLTLFCMYERVDTYVIGLGGMHKLENFLKQ
jgi:hypothetical protein